MPKTCPQCHGERVLADTCRMNGIDDFLVGVGKIISSDSHKEGPGANALTKLTFHADF